MVCCAEGFAGDPKRCGTCPEAAGAWDISYRHDRRQGAGELAARLTDNSARRDRSSTTGESLR